MPSESVKQWRGKPPENPWTQWYDGKPHKHSLYEGWEYEYRSLYTAEALEAEYRRGLEDAATHLSGILDIRKAAGARAGNDHIAACVTIIRALADKPKGDA